MAQTTPKSSSLDEGRDDGTTDAMTLKMANKPAEEYEKLREKYLEREIRLVLVGTTGVGKSSTGNTILGRKVFKASASSKSVTKSCQAAVEKRSGKYIKIVDVPGFIDTNMSKEEEKDAIIKCVIEASPGMHTILFIIRIGRFTEQDKLTIERFVEYFGKEAMQFVMIVFTGLDDLEVDEIKIEEYIANANKDLKAFLTLIQDRYIGVNNRDKNSDEFVNKLLEKVNMLSAANGGRCYTNELLQKAIEQVKTVEAEKFRQIRIQEDTKKEAILKKSKAEHEAQMQKQLQENKKLEDKFIVEERARKNADKDNVEMTKQLKAKEAARITAEKEKGKLDKQLEEKEEKLKEEKIAKDKARIKANEEKVKLEKQIENKEEERRKEQEEKEKAEKELDWISGNINNTKDEISKAAMSRGGKIGIGTSAGAVSGAAIGGVIGGPVGAAIGAACGAIAGLFAGIFG